MKNIISRPEVIGFVLPCVDKLISVAESLIDYPEKSRIVPELSLENIRELLYRNYRIVYLVKKNSLNILTVFERHQLLKRKK